MTKKDLDPQFDLEPEFDLEPQFNLEPQFDLDPQFDLEDRSLKAQSEDDKEFLDPNTTVIIVNVFWFTIRACLQSIIGWIAVKLFIPVWNWMLAKGKNDSKLASKVLAEEQEKETPDSVYR